LTVPAIVDDCKHNASKKQAAARAAIDVILRMIVDFLAFSGFNG